MGKWLTTVCTRRCSFTMRRACHQSQECDHEFLLPDGADERWTGKWSYPTLPYGIILSRMRKTMKNLSWHLASGLTIYQCLLRMQKGHSFCCVNNIAETNGLTTSHTGILITCFPTQCVHPSHTRIFKLKDQRLLTVCFGTKINKQIWLAIP
jgi:hypothetical protein